MLPKSQNAPPHLTESPGVRGPGRDGTKLALALQDNTVKVFYADTFKFALSLYGHKLPVNSISISSDSQLLVWRSGGGWRSAPYPHR